MPRRDKAGLGRPEPARSTALDPSDSRPGASDTRLGASDLRLGGEEEGEPELTNGVQSGSNPSWDTKRSRDSSLSRNQISSLFTNSSLNLPLRETSLNSTLTRDRSKDATMTKEIPKCKDGIKDSLVNRDGSKETALTRDNPFRDAILGLGNFLFCYVI